METGPNDDPIHAALARHREASTTFGIAFANRGRRTRSREADAAADELAAALDALVITAPTTMAGLLALLDHVAEHVEREDLAGRLDESIEMARQAVERRA